jgi:hypothetical protein
MTVTTDRATAAGAQASSAIEAQKRSAVRTMLSTVERVIFRGDSLSVARANAWAAVQEDRERAKARAAASADLRPPSVESDSSDLTDTGTETITAP